MRKIVWEIDDSYNLVEEKDPEIMNSLFEGEINVQIGEFNYYRWTHAPCEFCTWLCSQGWAEIAVPVVILNVISNKEPQLEEGYIIAWEYDCRTCCYYYNIQLPLLL